jgi:S1-C subfamily serine protease
MIGARVLCVAGVAAAALVPAGGDRHAPAPRIVRVAVTSPAGAAELATGFAAGGNRVVTVAHVLDAGGTLSVDGRTASVVRVDRRDDLALLTARGRHAPGVSTGSGTAATRLLLRSGPRPASMRRSITATVRIAPDAPVRRPALELAADVAHGDSGAPVLDDRGRVIGVVFAASTGRPHTAYAVDGAAVATLLAGG